MTGDSDRSRLRNVFYATPLMRFPDLSTKRLIWVTMTGVILAFALAALGSATSRAQQVVTVGGVVVNGTEAGIPPADTSVLLLVTNSDGGLTATSQAVTAQDGRFQFDQVPTEEGGSYVFSVDYAGVFYRSTFGLNDLSDEIRLTVYEPTEDPSVVTVTNQVMVITGIDTKNRRISAVEFVRLSNTSDVTLLPNMAMPQQLNFLRFALPPMAEDLDVASDLPGGDIVSIGTGFALTSPVIPGDHYVDFSFRFPYKDDVVSYRQSLPQGAEVYRVMALAQFDGFQVAPLDPLPAVDIEGALYRAWEGLGFGRGQGLQLELTNLPQPSMLERLEKSLLDGAFWRIAIPCAVGAVLALLLLWGIRGRWRGVAGYPSPGDNDGDSVQVEALVGEIASLDERYQSGDLDEAEYRLQRKELVDQVLGSGGPTSAEAEPEPQDRPPPQV